MRYEGHAHPLGRPDMGAGYASVLFGICWTIGGLIDNIAKA